MIESKDLRIGNLVNEEVLGDCQVSGISKETVWVEVKNIKSNGSHNLREFHININFLKPIPLTEEWLLKFGFSKNENDVLQIETTLMPLSITLSDNYPDEKYKAWVYEDENSSYHIISDNIKYVHQLQNLYFDLTNEELTLNK